jgi:HTH-type transcriptional regulator/antitoxin HigA
MDTSVIAPIRTEQDYRNAEQTVRALWGATPGTPEADRLDVLMVLLEAYEAEHHRIEPPDRFFVAHLPRELW